MLSFNGFSFSSDSLFYKSFLTSELWVSMLNVRIFLCRLSLFWLFLISWNVTSNWDSFCGLNSPFYSFMFIVVIFWRLPSLNLLYILKYFDDLSLILWFYIGETALNIFSPPSLYFLLVDLNSLEGICAFSVIFLFKFTYFFFITESINDYIFLSFFSMSIFSFLDRWWLIIFVFDFYFIY